MRKTKKRIAALTAGLMLAASAVGYMPAAPVSSAQLLLAEFETTDDSFTAVRLTKYNGKMPHIVLPSTIQGLPVKELAKGFLSKDNFTVSVVIPESTEAVGDTAFMCCKRLSDILIPEQLTNFGAAAFSGTPWMDAKLAENPLVIINNTVLDGTTCTGDVVIPEGVTGIGNYAFRVYAPGEGTTKSTPDSVTLPESLKWIGHSAFRNCGFVQSMTVPDSVDTIYAYAFEGCRNLKDIHLPASLKRVARGVFNGCSNLKSIVIPDSVTEIAPEAFFRCESLETVTFPANLKTVGEYAFKDCAALRSAELPSGVESIRRNAFARCTSLTSFTVPDSVTAMENGVLAGCSRLTALTIPDSVREIQSGALSFCIGLNHVEIPASVYKIGEGALGNCTRLESITFPAGVRLVEAGALSCNSGSALKKVTFLNPNCEISLGKITHVDPASDEQPDLDYTGTICGYRGSTAEAYAAENGYRFEALGETPLPARGDVNADGAVDAEDVKLVIGDLNGDGDVCVDDAQIALRAYAAHVAGTSGTLSASQKQAADITGDGEVCVDDAQLILKYYILRRVAQMEVTWEMLLSTETNLDFDTILGK